MACCCVSPVFTCGSCAKIPSNIAVTITSSGGNPLTDVGCVYGETSFVVSRPNGWYYQYTCNTCTGDGTQYNYWTTGQSPKTLIAENNGQCSPQTPYYISQGILYCVLNSLRLEWFCGAYLVNTSCGQAYRMPLPSSFLTNSNPLVFTNTTINSCSPFSATSTTSYNGKTYTATFSEVNFP